MDMTRNLERVRFLQGDRLFLTPECIDDYDNYYRWQNDREIQAGDGSTYRPLGPEKARKNFEAQLEDKGFIRLSIIMSNTGAHAGRICIYDIDPQVRVAQWGLLLDKAFWRQGIGTEAARLLLAYAFGDLGMRKMHSVTNSGNVASVKFQESLGLVQEACLRQQEIINNQKVDQLHFGMLRAEYEEQIGRG